MPATKNHRGWGYIRQLPNKSKRFQASYIGPDDARHNAPTTFDHKTEAELWLGSERKLIKDTALGGQPWTPPAQRAAVSTAQRETLADYAKTVIAQRKVKDRTRIHYTEILENHIAPKLGKLPVDSITPQTVRNWHTATLTDKPTMRAHAYQLLNLICGTAVKDGLAERNPCMIDGASSAKTTRELTLLTAPELHTVADSITPQRFRALVLISAWCGLRYGEVTELRRKDIRLDKSGKVEVISVARGVTHHSGCHLSTPKSGKTRNVVVPPHIRADLANHLASYVSADAEGLLFPPVRGGCHLVEKVFRDAFKTALKTIGRDDVRIHDLRHFAGSMVARVGNLVETMAHLGHSTSTASLRYQHLVSGRDVEIAAALSALAQRPALAVVTDDDDQASATA
jgi:integrase